MRNDCDEEHDRLEQEQPQAEEERLRREKQD
jgi:hypothetical protein